jgi:hypothetical protein
VCQPCQRGGLQSVGAREVEERCRETHAGQRCSHVSDRGSEQGKKEKKPRRHRVARMNGRLLFCAAAALALVCLVAAEKDYYQILGLKKEAGEDEVRGERRVRV